MVTSVQIEDKTWEQLRDLKERRGETFDDVIVKLIKFKKEKKIK